VWLSGRQRFLNGGQHVCRMTFNLHLGEDVGKATIRANDECSAIDAEIGPPIERLFDPDAIGFGRFVLRVGEYPERQAEFGGELLLRLDRIGADAQDYGVGAIERIVNVAERGGFVRSSGRVRLRIEK